MVEAGGIANLDVEAEDFAEISERAGVEDNVTSRLAAGGGDGAAAQKGAPPALVLPTGSSLSAVTAAPFCTVTLLVRAGSPTWTMRKSIGAVVRTFATAGVWSGSAVFSSPLIVSFEF